jgi:hypothetical protein
VSHRQGAGVEPHHIKGFDMHMGKKSCDLFVIPLHYKLHHLLHQHGWRDFEERYNMSQATEAMHMIQQAYDEGIIEIRRY